MNNFLGGRTYPFKGTLILLPQHSPYTQPLTILICGGSTPGPEIALDNCVSTQTESPSPQWPIKRMPSQRVLSCITALPDGTYLKHLHREIIWVNELFSLNTIVKMEVEVVSSLRDPILAYVRQAGFSFGFWMVVYPVSVNLCE